MIAVEELVPRPDTDDPDWEGVAAFSIPQTNSVVLAWQTDVGLSGSTFCWSAIEDCSDWCDSGYADDQEGALFSGTMSGMARVSQRITQAYYRKLIGK